MNSSIHHWYWKRMTIRDDGKTLFFFHSFLFWFHGLEKKRKHMMMIWIELNWLNEWIRIRMIPQRNADNLLKDDNDDDDDEQ